MFIKFIPQETLDLIECRKSKHYCVIRYGGKIIATGYNQPGAFKYKGRHYMRHAECMALKNLPRKFCIKGKTIDLLVIRHGLAESKPCQHCIDYMKRHEANIRRVSYSTCGDIVTENLCQIKNNHLTVHWIAN